MKQPYTLLLVTLIALLMPDLARGACSVRSDQTSVREAVQLFTERPTEETLTYWYTIASQWGGRRQTTGVPRWMQGSTLWGDSFLEPMKVGDCVWGEWVPALKAAFARNVTGLLLAGRLFQDAVLDDLFGDPKFHHPEKVDVVEDLRFRAAQLREPVSEEDLQAWQVYARCRDAWDRRPASGKEPSCDLYAHARFNPSTDDGVQWKMRRLMDGGRPLLDTIATLCEEYAAAIEKREAPGQPPEHPYTWDDIVRPMDPDQL